MNDAVSTETTAQPHSRTDLFLSFSWLALQGFGGVLAVVQRELVERKRWLSREQFVEDWAVAQILPGPNVVNLSLMIGGRCFGPSGALAALAGMLLLPLLVILVLAIALSSVATLEPVVGALRGMGAVAAALVTATGLKLAAALHQNVLGPVLCWTCVLLTVVCMAWLRWPLTWVLIGLGGLSSVYAWWRLGQHAHTPNSTAP